MTQGNKSVIEYDREFTKLTRFARSLVATEKDKVERFVNGLRLSLQKDLALCELSSHVVFPCESSGQGLEGGMGPGTDEYRPEDWGEEVDSVEEPPRKEEGQVDRQEGLEKCERRLRALWTQP